jgi:hypothetical protein
MPFACQSTGTSLEHIVATCDDFAQSGHLKKIISYCSSIGCVSTGAIVVLQTVQVSFGDCMFGEFLFAVMGRDRGQYCAILCQPVINSAHLAK